MVNNKGISLISVIVTIITIIILASIAIFNGYSTPDTAIFSNFSEEITNIKIAVAKIRANDLAYNDDENHSFREVKLVDAPKEFISFSDEEKVGYVVDTSLLDYHVNNRGNGVVSDDTVTFGQDDVFVYDKNGAIYYARGYENDGVLYYNVNSHK